MVFLSFTLKTLFFLTMFNSILTLLISIFKGIPQLKDLADKLLEYKERQMERERQSKALKRKDEKKNTIDDWFNDLDD